MYFCIICIVIVILVRKSEHIMLKPTKHLNLNLSPLRVAAIILRYLRRTRLASYDQLLTEVTSITGVDSKDTVYIIIPAINLIYLLGKLEYYPKTDSFEFLE